MHFDIHVVCVCVCLRAMPASWHLLDNFTNFHEIYLKITQLEISLYMCLIISFTRK